MITTASYSPPDALLRHHGDADNQPGLVDLAVNVRHGTPPQWLTERLAAVDLARYPDPARAVEAVAARHRRPAAQVLITAGAAEAFVLIARAFEPRHAVVVHPQFTEPEVALRAAGHDVERIVLPPPFTLDPALVPHEADVVVVGNPTNPTSILHPTRSLACLARPGRLLVVDEAFADCVPGEPESLSERADLPGLVVIRSLTKTWGLAGLRIGYVLAEAPVIAALAAAQPRWAVSAPALEACAACCAPAATDQVQQWGHRLHADRTYLLDQLADVPGAQVVREARASFLLLHTERPGVVKALRRRGFAARRGDTFPGLGPQWLRIAVRDHATSDAFVTTLRDVLQEDLR